MTFYFDHVIAAIQEYSVLSIMKLEDVVGSLEAHDMCIVKRRGDQEAIQTLQALTWKKHGGVGRFKEKFDKINSKKGLWHHS